MMINVLNPMMLIKGHGIYTYHPNGPAMLRNPPAQNFRAGSEPDIPAFAHDGNGNTDEGEFVQGPHGEHVYQTARGEFRHGIDGVISRVGHFLAQRGDTTNPKAVVQRAIDDFNKNHAMAEQHSLPSVDDNEWRKIRLGPLQTGAGNDSPTRTHEGTLITHLHNKNADTAPIGKFLESASMPIHRELNHVLTNLMGHDSHDVKSLNFTKYPYVYAHDLAPHTYATHKDQPDAQIPDQYRNRAPEGYFPDMDSIHSWEVAHQLPKIMHYPKIGKRGPRPADLKRRAHQHIEEALQHGVEHIPDIQIQINLGSHLRPDFTQVNLREALSDAGLRERLIDDVSNAPSLMFLFGRSGQGDANDVLNYMNEKYGMGEDGLTLDQHKEYVTSGSASGGAGTHTNAARLYALARKSGAVGEDGRSHMGEHEITQEELQMMGLPHNEMALKHADRYQTIVEALADHQASARGHEVRLGVGDIPDSPMQNASIGNYPESAEGLDPHMDAFTHRVEDYAPTSPSEVSPLGVRPGRDAVAAPDAVPIEEQIPPSEQVTATGPSSHGISPPVSAGPHTTPTPRTQPVAVATPRPPMQAPRPLPPRTMQMREAVAGYNPQQLQQFVQQAGVRLPQGRTPQQFQQVMGDPKQTLMEQWTRSEDTHLPIMDRVLKQLERLQMSDAKEDTEILKNVKPHFRDSRLLAKHLNLTREDVHSISHATGDWYRIAKTFRVDPKVVKVIKVNTGDI
tara:strand:+ start:8253 stop:10457 length:2205 start_codon:yes stop_codon:yes gene_type:complete